MDQANKENIAPTAAFNEIEKLAFYTLDRCRRRRGVTLKRLTTELSRVNKETGYRCPRVRKKQRVVKKEAPTDSKEEQEPADIKEEQEPTIKEEEEEEEEKKE